MLTEICQEIRNFFEKKKFLGDFEIKGGTIAPLDFLQEGQYFRIVGSIFNDGIYQYPAAELKDESFTGAVWALAIPPAFLTLAKDIESFQAEQKPSAFTSESFGGYSYTKATKANGTAAGWKDVFSDRLNRWRKI